MAEGRPPAEIPDIDEKGGPIDGVPQSSSRRLFVQLLAFGGCTDSGSLVDACCDGGFEGALYEDVNDPRGVALVSFSSDPNHFLDVMRPFLASGPFNGLQPKPEYTMLGRSYTLGYEPDLQEALIDRPRQRILNPDWPWVVWYPLRRSGQFEQLDAAKQREILMEHGRIGISFGAGDYAHDVRLACHGLDKHDNDFVIGLVGKDVLPLSKIVQTMRKTQQTSLYLERLGPFFVGRAAWQSPM
ncbi:MAG: chlorite dismutase family protein [Phycisphaerae bacterium]|nr:chlorite dismutase family protein [Phycisphaerae bacterium]